MRATIEFDDDDIFEKLTTNCPNLNNRWDHECDLCCGGKVLTVTGKKLSALFLKGLKITNDT